MATGADHKDVFTHEASDIRHQRLAKQAVKGTLYLVGYYGITFVRRFAQRPRHEYRTVFLKYWLPVLAVGGLGLVLVVCAGDQAVLHLYDHRYRGAAWMVGVLAVGLWHTMLYSTLSPAILALSTSHYNAAANLIYCVSLFTLILLGFHFYGMLGAAVAVAAGDLPVYFVVFYAAY